MAGTFARVIAWTRKIPRGRVATYGQLAKLSGTIPRVVGYAMRSPGEFPWHRVLGQRRRGVGHITIGDASSAAKQRRLLEMEGVVFSASGAIDLAVFGFHPKAAASAHARARPAGRPG